MDINLDIQHQPVIECLASVARIDILRLLSMEPMSATDVAARLHLTKGIVSRHLNLLEECGFITHVQKKGIHGLRKEYSLREKSITIRFSSSQPVCEQQDAKRIGIGCYEECMPIAPCGLSRNNVVIGLKNDPRFFSNPARADVDDLWMARGFMTYALPFTVESIRKAAGMRVTVTAFCDSYAPGRTGKRLLISLGSGDKISVPLTYREDDDLRAVRDAAFYRVIEWRGGRVLLDGADVGEFSLTDVDSASITLAVSGDDSSAIVHFIDGILCELNHDKGR